MIAAVSTYACPACGYDAYVTTVIVATAREGRRFSMALVCDGCTTISELSGGIPARLTDLHNIRLSDLEDGQPELLTPLTRTAQPFTTGRRES